MTMKRTVEKKDFKGFVREAQSWETSRLQTAQHSERKAWRVAAGAGLTTVAMALAIAMMMPLKQVEPFVVRVDNSSGKVDIVQALTDGKTTYDEAVNKYFVQRYTHVREDYSADLAKVYYDAVGLMSGPAEAQRYVSLMDKANPKSPLKLYGNAARVVIDVASTSFVSPGVALVRFTKSVERSGTQPLLSYWAATITFHFSKAPMSDKDREINPLGFQVDEYRVDQDSGVDLSAAQPVPRPAVAQTAPVAPALSLPTMALSPTAHK